MGLKAVMAFGLFMVTAVTVAETISISLATTGKSADAASPTAGDVVKVMGKGVGVDKAGALKDAYRDAVERAVGLFVDAEQMLRNDEVLNDQVLTQSNAYIEKREIVKESQADGVTTVQILAFVRKRALVKRVSEFMPVQNVSLGDSLQNLHANMTTEAQRSKDGAALLANALKGVDPVKMLMKASLRPDSMQKVTDTNPYWFKGGKIGEGQVGLSYLCEVELDRDKYFKEFVPKLKQVLDQISIEAPKEFRISSISESAHSCRDERVRIFLAGGVNRGVHGDADDMCRGNGFYDPLFVIRGTVAEKTWVWGRSDLSVFGSSLNCPGEKLVVRPDVFQSDRHYERCECVLVTELNDKLTFGKAVQYVLDADEQKCLDAWMRSWGCLALQGGTVNYNIVFKDAEGDEVGAFPWSVSKSTLSNVGVGLREEYEPTVNMTKNIAVCYISPQVGCAGAKFLTWRDFVFDQDDLARIKSVSIELAE